MNPFKKRNRERAMGDEATREEELSARGEEPETPDVEPTSEENPEEDPDENSDETPLERAERERGEYLVQWQRSRADYQNLRRRTLEDIQSAMLRERTAILEETLTVLDYLDMALAAPCETEEARNLQVGVQMTRDQLWALLERSEVAAIETEGEFDPRVHTAMATVETDERPPGTIVEIVRRGFKMADRVLRHAQVKVASAPASEDEDEGAGNEPTGTGDENAD